jgi:iron(III) transport system ATP-binding protein
MKTGKIVQTQFSSPPAIRLRNLIKLYDHCPAVRDVTLKVNHGHTLALVGPSGCGKTTLLRMIAGLETPDSGEIWLDKRLVSGPGCLVPPYKRGVGMVFQDLALWPHMTARQQLSFVLGREKKAEKNERIEETFDLVRLARPDSYPHQLSGGEQQRLALARALAPRPGILLFDEPLSNLDPALKLELLPEIKELLVRLHITAVYVTHQWEEAEYLADTVATMQAGQIVQLFSTAEFTAEIARRTKEIRSNVDRGGSLPAKVIRMHK